MSDRRKQIILLIGSRFDYTFEPETFTGKVVRRGATAGKGSPSHWQPCDACSGSGSVTRYRKLERCESCSGQGRRRVDDYTGATVVTDEARNVGLAELIRRDTKHVRCPDCQDLAGNATGVIRGRVCRRCNGTGEAAIAGSWLSEPADGDRAGGDALEAMLAAIDRRNQVGSYHELDLALAQLSLWTVRLLDGFVAGDRSRDLEGTFAFIDARMPDPIVVPRDVQRNAEEREKALKARGQALTALERDRRDKRIRRWDRDGKPRQWIGQQTGLSDRQLREIINGGLTPSGACGYHANSRS